MTDWRIYTLTDPRTNLIRYVGFTSQKLCKRLSAHLYTAKTTRKPNHLTNWLNQLIKLSLRPSIQSVEEGSGDGWPSAECRWIAHFKAQGFPLTNCAEGGKGPTGAKRSPEFIENVRNRARKTYQQHGKALTEAARLQNIGRQVSEATRLAVSRASKAAKLRDPGLNVAERNGRATITWDIVKQIRQMFHDLGGRVGQRTRRGTLTRIQQHFGLSFGVVQPITQHTKWKEPDVQLPSVDD